MSEEHVTTDAAVDEEFTAAAPPDPEAPGTGETSFADAQAPAASEPRESAPAGEEDEIAKWKDVAHRKAAEFENYRKRMARENAQAAERGTARLVKELLPALDHLELALKSAGDDEVVKGFALIRDELVTALERVGVQRFSPEGEPFDPAEHEAMVQRPAQDAESGTVVEVYQQGYRINGSVLRPARVVVAE
jgi:molecular chaperone GrpE